MQPGFWIYIFGFNHQDKVNLPATSIIVSSCFTKHLTCFYSSSFTYTYTCKIAVSSKIFAMPDRDSHAISKIIYPHYFSVKNDLTGTPGCVPIVRPGLSPFSKVPSIEYGPKPIFKNPLSTGHGKCPRLFSNPAFNFKSDSELKATVGFSIGFIRGVVVTSGFSVGFVVGFVSGFDFSLLHLLLFFPLPFLMLRSLGVQLQ